MPINDPQARLLEGARERIQECPPALGAHPEGRRVALGDRDQDASEAAPSKRAGDRVGEA